MTTFRSGTNGVDLARIWHESGATVARKRIFGSSDTSPQDATKPATPAPTFGCTQPHTFTTRSTPSVARRRTPGQRGLRALALPQGASRGGAGPSAQLQRQTFGRYAQDWLAHRELAASTRYNYSQLLNTTSCRPSRRSPSPDRPGHRRRVASQHRTRHATCSQTRLHPAAQHPQRRPRRRAHRPQPRRHPRAGNVNQSGATHSASLDELEAIVYATRPVPADGAPRWLVRPAQGELSELRRNDVDTPSWTGHRH